MRASAGFLPVGKPTWNDVTGKPTSYPPSPHTHSISDVTGLQGALDGKQPAGGYVTTANFTWGNLSGKPTTFTPSAHTHLWGDITDKPATFAPAAHTHAGLLTLVGNVVVTETLLLSLAVGMKRMTLPLAGVTPADMGKLVVVPNGTATAGCEVQNAYPTATAGQVSVGYYTPLLGIGATYSIPASVYRIS